jgi:hypothetical protein
MSFIEPYIDEAFLAFRAAVAFAMWQGSMGSGESSPLLMRTKSGFKDIIRYGSSPFLYFA